MGTIYKLNFENGQFYIGKTTKNINTRIRFHLNQKGKGCPKLEEAFKNSTYKNYEILEENVPLDVINITEQKYIKELNPSLNTLPGGEGLAGLNAPRSKYTEEQIIDIGFYFLETSLSYKEISDITNVHIATVRDICFERTHSWLFEKIDKNLIEQARANRTKQFIIYDINNNKYEVNNISKFLLEHPSVPRSLFNSAKGVSSNGWSLFPHKFITLISPTGKVIETTEFKAKILLKEEGLTQYNIDRILKGKKSANWDTKKYTNISL